MMMASRLCSTVHLCVYMMACGRAAFLFAKRAPSSTLDYEIELFFSDKNHPCVDIARRTDLRGVV